MKKAIIIIISAVILIAGTSLVGFYYMGDRIIEEVILSDMLEEQETEGNTSESTVTGGKGAAESVKVDNTAAAAQENIQPESPAAGAAQKNIQPEPQAAGTAVSSTDTSDAAETGTSEPKLPDQNTAPGIAPPNPPENTESITTKKVQEVKEKVTAPEKVETAALALKRLSASDISVLKSMLDNGLTSKELSEAKKMAYSRFTEEEIAQLKAMYRKYMD